MENNFLDRIVDNYFIIISTLAEPIVFTCLLIIYFIFSLFYFFLNKK